MLTTPTLRSLLICSVILCGLGIWSYPHWGDLLANSKQSDEDRLGNNANLGARTNVSTELVSTYPSQNPPVSIAINQSGNIRQADPRGYINVGIGETYKIEINSPNYTTAVSVKIDGVSIIDGLICDRSVTLERPHAIAKQFIVLEEGNPGLDRNGGVNNPDLGLIEVTFVPIKRRDAIVYKSPTARESIPSASAPSRDEASKARASENQANAVGTGLSGTSSQEFVATNEWVEAPDIAPIYNKKYRLIGSRSLEPVTLHNMKQNRPSAVTDPVPPRM